MLRTAKFFFAVVSFFVLAWLLYASPVPEIAEELPMHREIGIGFAILGVISALAVPEPEHPLVSRSSTPPTPEDAP